MVGLTEVKKEWRNILYENTIWVAITGWNENRRIKVAQNTTKPTDSSKYLVGGRAMIAFGELVFRISCQEGDSWKLGIWINITLIG